MALSRDVCGPKLSANRTDNKMKALTKAMDPRCRAQKVGSWCYAKPVSHLHPQTGNCFQSQSNCWEGGREQVEGRLQLLLHSPPSSNPISTLLERLGLNSSSFCSIDFYKPSLITLKLTIFIIEYPEVYGGHFHTSSPLLLTRAHLVESFLEQCTWHSPVAATALRKVRYQISFS